MSKWGDSDCGESEHEHEHACVVDVSSSSSCGKNKRAEQEAPPCTECGKKLWSWKALFGHMRCHPERHWRGINPPRNVVVLRSARQAHEPHQTMKEHEVAECLLLLASGREKHHERLGCSTTNMRSSHTCSIRLSLSLDLNLPAPLVIDDDEDHHSPLSLDLRLGL